MQNELNAGKRDVELGQRRREKRDRQRRCRTDRKAPAAQVGELADLPGGTVDVGENAARPRQERLARGRERDVPGHPMEEGSTELFFEHADRARHRRLCHAEPARGLGEVPLLRDGDEVAQLMELDPHSVPLSTRAL